ncbi:hypothetical protein BDV96DRAFT_651112 [Lophiotrema nucula]|uniref:AA1-like domain-containing protein n=1 Tax=Lophiotrema nucula TaxID=690887 RepID=A0A6A5YTY4_9PLEO|nr:hypothetical protein BDV96DRAFT_651112 [Lophiotrema nucula]
MRFAESSTFALLSTLVLAKPVPIDVPHEPQILHVTDFEAFLSNDVTALSHVSFHIRDLRTGNQAEADCNYSTRNGDDLISGNGWHECDLPDPDFNFEFGFRHGSLQVKKPFLTNPADPKTWAYAWSDYQNGNWTEGINATKTNTGLIYSRTTDWEFTLVTMIG